MATARIRLHFSFDRKRFMLWTVGAVSGTVGLVYLGAALRYLYPRNAENTPPLTLRLSGGGVTEPVSGAHHGFEQGVAGPIYYPMTADNSVVVGVFVEKKDARGPLVAGNLLVAEQTCTHLGCPVAWVGSDNQYECPCHGSRFHREGGCAPSTRSRSMQPNKPLDSELLRLTDHYRQSLQRPGGPRSRTWCAATPSTRLTWWTLPPRRSAWTRRYSPRAWAARIST